MSFEFSSQGDQETFMSLKGLCNKNNGFFKSLKQAQFLFKQYSNSSLTVEGMRENYGVTLSEGQVATTVTAITRWANYGSRSMVPVMFAFVIDRMGVAALYRIGGTGNLREGWAPVPEKTRVEWTRDVSITAPFAWPTEEEQAAAAATEPVSQWIGTVGHRVEIQATLIRSRDMGVSRFGPMWLSVFQDTAGNIVNVWKNFDLAIGAQVNMTALVKSQDEYRGQHQTTVTRVKFA